MELTSGSNQRYKRGQKSLLDQTALAGPLQNGYSLVHGRIWEKTLSATAITGTRVVQYRLRLTQTAFITGPSSDCSSLVRNFDVLCPDV